MCSGVTSGFAGMKLSIFPKIYGLFGDRVDRILNRIATCIQVGILLDLLDPENRGNILFRNIG
jgi:hypothetical protein